MNQTNQPPMGHPMQSPQMSRPMGGSPSMQMSGSVQPAGFWIRFVAYMIDSILISIVYYMLLIPVAILVPGVANPEMASNAAIGAIFVSYGIFFAIYIAYMIYFYTQKGGTLGKLALNIRVINLNTGARMTWGQVIMREIFGKFLSGMILLIGYIMAGLRSDKRALHDLLAGSQCLRKK